MEIKDVGRIMDGFDESFGAVTKKVTGGIKDLLEKTSELAGRRMWQDAPLAELEGDLLVLAALLNEYLTCRVHAETRSANGERTLRAIARYAVRLPGPRGLAVDAFAVMNREGGAQEAEPETASQEREKFRLPKCLNCGSRMLEDGSIMLSDRDETVSGHDDRVITHFSCLYCGAGMEFVFPAK